MYDIFLSYATADRQRVQPLAAALKQQGWSVFWDHESVRTGKNWHRTIDEALTTSRCVVVVWTEHSINRDFVLEEATEARDRGVLLPILWDDVRPPLGFRLRQAISFLAWDGRVEHPLFAALAADIRSYLPATLDTPQKVATSAEIDFLSRPETRPAPILARLPFEPEMVVIPAGSFTMGWVEGRDGEEIRYAKPAHTVYLKGFELGKYPVTQAQWQAVMGSNPSYFKDGGDTCPVECVSWDDVQTFIQKLNAMTDKTYRLPSEAEWEYAGRAGQNTLYCGGNDVDAVAWYDGNSGGKTHPVGQKQANAWGAHDMSGNVCEWVQDSCYTYQRAPTDGIAWEEDSGAERREMRGGSWNYLLANYRAAHRESFPSYGRSSSVGFRLARTLP